MLRGTNAFDYLKGQQALMKDADLYEHKPATHTIPQKRKRKKGKKEKEKAQAPRRLGRTTMEEWLKGWPCGLAKGPTYI